MPKVSIVVPIYNVEKYLSECMDSVLSQTLEDIEIICVDDGSTDSSGRLIDNYAKADQRIKVVHKENAGYGHAVNVGVDMAAGEYVGIVEPDDFIAYEMLDKLYNIAKRDNLDFIKSDYYTFSGDSDKYIIQKQKLVLNEDLYDRVLDKKDIRLLFHHGINNWTGLYKRDFLERFHVRHNETPGASYQDTGFCFLVYMYADAGYVVDEGFYHYRIDNSNSSINRKDKVYCISEELKYIYDRICKGNQLQYFDVYLERKFFNCLWNLNRIDAAYRKEFFDFFIKDFQALQKRDELNLDYFTDIEKKILAEMLNSPDEYIKRMLNIADYIHTLTSAYKKIIIYGAGKIARSIYMGLNLEEKEKVSCFMVSRFGNLESREIDGKSIIEYSIDYSREEDTCVIIAVNKNNDAQISELLRKDSWGHVISMYEAGVWL